MTRFAQCLDDSRTAPWHKFRPEPYRHPPTRMELDRKYRSLNDIKLTGIDAYMNRSQDLPEHPVEVISLHNSIGE